MWKGNDKIKTFAGAKITGILPMEKQNFDIYTVKKHKMKQNIKIY